MAALYDSCMAWVESNMLTCPSKKLTHLDCPGCGFQRGTVAMLKGDLKASWQVYPTTTFIWFTMLLLCVHLLFKLKQGAKILKYVYIVTALVMLINYFYKFFTNQLI